MVNANDWFQWKYSLFFEGSEHSAVRLIEKICAFHDCKPLIMWALSHGENQLQLQWFYIFNCQKQQMLIFHNNRPFVSNQSRFSLVCWKKCSINNNITTYSFTGERPTNFTIQMLKCAFEELTRRQFENETRGGRRRRKNTLMSWSK